MMNYRVKPTMPRGDATHLARWRDYGFGPSSPYLSYREGRDAEDTFASESTRLHFTRQLRNSDGISGGSPDAIGA
jgi:hypothetical protein